jgi:predicted O-methyltransferase YrrM
MPSIIQRLATAARRAAEVARSAPRRRKYAWAPWWAPVRTEACVHPHSAAERAELFEAFNAGTTEYEVLNWLHATVMLLKPAHVLETGAADGIGTVALASACRNNGFGTVHSVEIDTELCRALETRLRRRGLSASAEVHCESSLDYLRRTDTVFDVGFFDSLCELRAEEFRTCLDRGILRKLAVFHDTSPLRTRTLPVAPSPELHAAYRRDVLALARDPRCTGWYESPLSRGFIAIFVDPASVVSADGSTEGSTSATADGAADGRGGAAGG